MDEQRWERIERTMEFMVNEQARYDARFQDWQQKIQVKVDELFHAQAGHQVMIDTLFDLHRSLDSKLDRVVESIRDLAEENRKLAKAQREFVEAQRHTDERLNALIGFVDPSTPRSA